MMADISTMTRGDAVMNGKDRRYDKAGREIEVVLAPLQVDYSYQRPVRSHHKRIAENWDPQAAGRLTVARRQDGSLWIIDGQQRREAMLLLGISKWKAVVVDSEGPAHEAHIFTVMNGGTGTAKGLTQRELFKAQIASRDPAALEVVRVCEAAGLKVHVQHGGNRPQWPWIGCTKFLYDSVKSVGADPVSSALSVIVSAWPGQYKATEASVIGALVHAIHYRKADPKRLGEVLAGVPFLQLFNEARTFAANNGPGLVSSVYALVAKKYNTRLPQKSRIPLKMRASRTRDSEVTRKGGDESEG